MVVVSVSDLVVSQLKSYFNNRILKQITLCLDKQIIYTRYQNGKLIPKKTVHTFIIRKRYFYYEFRVPILLLRNKAAKIVKAAGNKETKY